MRLVSSCHGAFCGDGSIRRQSGLNPTKAPVRTGQGGDSLIGSMNASMVLVGPAEEGYMRRNSEREFARTPIVFLTLTLAVGPA